MILAKILVLATGIYIGSVLLHAFIHMWRIRKHYEDSAEAKIIRRAMILPGEAIISHQE
jgi:hypothetical protein